MRIHQSLCRYALTSCCLLAASTHADAAEYAFSTYGLGESAFSAGVTPPPGTYVSVVTGYFSGQITGTVSFGGVTLNAGFKADALSPGFNLLYVPDRKVFGGNLGLSITVPSGFVDYRASVEVLSLGFSREVSGWGIGDVIPRVQLGWQHGDFAHTVYLEAITPTGFWEPGFKPLVGFHRPGIDAGWAFTWTDKRTKLQVNGTAGFTFNFENTATNYQSGNEFHWEWAVGIECLQGLVLGVVGYDYRQLTPDSGSGDTIGPFKGVVDAVGPGLSYTTVIDKRPVTFNLRYYHEYNFENRVHGDSTLASATVKF